MPAPPREGGRRLAAPCCKSATLVPVGEVQVQGGDRLDRLAATHLGDPIQYWRIADGNGAQAPSELEHPGDTLRLTLPAGLGGGGA